MLGSPALPAAASRRPSLLPGRTGPGPGAFQHRSTAPSRRKLLWLPRIRFRQPAVGCRRTRGALEPGPRPISLRVGCACSPGMRLSRRQARARAIRIRSHSRRTSKRTTCIPSPSDPSGRTTAPKHSMRRCRLSRRSRPRHQGRRHPRRGCIVEPGTGAGADPLAHSIRAITAAPIIDPPRAWLVLRQERLDGGPCLVREPKQRHRASPSTHAPHES